MGGMQVILYIKCLFGDDNGEWTMETEWWAEDFDSPIVLCLANIKQRRKIYPVAHSCFAVNSRNSWDCRRTSSWSRDAGFYFNDNGEWRLMKWTNGDRHWPAHQESSCSEYPSGDPSSRLGDQGQWSKVWAYRQWKLDHEQWTLRIIWPPSKEGPSQVQIQGNQQNNVCESTQFDVQRT